MVSSKVLFTLSLTGALLSLGWAQIPDRKIEVIPTFSKKTKRDKLKYKHKDQAGHTDTKGQDGSILVGYNGAKITWSCSPACTKIEFDVGKGPCQQAPASNDQGETWTCTVPPNLNITDNCHYTDPQTNTEDVRQCFKYGITANDPNGATFELKDDPEVIVDNNVRIEWKRKHLVVERRSGAAPK